MEENQGPEVQSGKQMSHEKSQQLELLHLNRSANNPNDSEDYSRISLEQRGGLTSDGNFQLKNFQKKQSTRSGPRQQFPKNSSDSRKNQDLADQVNFQIDTMNRKNVSSGYKRKEENIPGSCPNEGASHPLLLHQDKHVKIQFKDQINSEKELAEQEPAQERQRQINSDQQSLNRLSAEKVRQKATPQVQDNILSSNQYLNLQQRKANYIRVESSNQATGVFNSNKKIHLKPSDASDSQNQNGGKDSFYPSREGSTLQQGVKTISQSFHSKQGSLIRYPQPTVTIKQSPKNKQHKRAEGLDDLVEVLDQSRSPLARLSGQKQKNCRNPPGFSPFIAKSRFVTKMAHKNQQTNHLEETNQQQQMYFHMLQTAGINSTFGGIQLNSNNNTQMSKRNSGRTSTSKTIFQYQRGDSKDQIDRQVSDSQRYYTMTPGEGFSNYLSSQRPGSNYQHVRGQQVTVGDIVTHPDSITKQQTVETSQSMANHQQPWMIVQKIQAQQRQKQPRVTQPETSSKVTVQHTIFPKQVDMFKVMEINIQSKGNHPIQQVYQEKKSGQDAFSTFEKQQVINSIAILQKSNPNILSNNQLDQEMLNLSKREGSQDTHKDESKAPDGTISRSAVSSTVKVQNQVAQEDDTNIESPSPLKINHYPAFKNQDEELSDARQSTSNSKASDKRTVCIKNPKRRSDITGFQLHRIEMGEIKQTNPFQDCSSIVPVNDYNKGHPSSKMAMSMNHGFECTCPMCLVEKSPIRSYGNNSIQTEQMKFELNKGSMTQILSKVSAESNQGDKKATRMSALQEESETGRKDYAEARRQSFTYSGIDQWQHEKEQSLISLQEEDSHPKKESEPTVQTSEVAYLESEFRKTPQFEAYQRSYNNNASKMNKFRNRQRLLEFKKQKYNGIQMNPGRAKSNIVTAILRRSKNGFSSVDSSLKMEILEESLDKINGIEKSDEDTSKNEFSAQYFLRAQIPNADQTNHKRMYVFSQIRPSDQSQKRQQMSSSSNNRPTTGQFRKSNRSSDLVTMRLNDLPPCHSRIQSNNASQQQSQMQGKIWSTGSSPKAMTPLNIQKLPITRINPAALNVLQNGQDPQNTIVGQQQLSSGEDGHIIQSFQVQNVELNNSGDRSESGPANIVIPCDFNSKTLHKQGQESSSKKQGRQQEFLIRGQRCSKQYSNPYQTIVDKEQAKSSLSVQKDKRENHELSRASMLRGRMAKSDLKTLKSGDISAKVQNQMAQDFFYLNQTPDGLEHAPFPGIQLGGRHEITDVTEKRPNPTDTPSLGLRNQISTEYFRNYKKAETGEGGVLNTGNDISVDQFLQMHYDEAARADLQSFFKNDPSPILQHASVQPPMYSQVMIQHQKYPKQPGSLDSKERRPNQKIQRVANKANPKFSKSHGVRKIRSRKQGGQTYSSNLFNVYSTSKEGSPVMAKAAIKNLPSKNRVVGYNLKDNVSKESTYDGWDDTAPQTKDRSVEDEREQMYPSQQCSPDDLVMSRIQNITNCRVKGRLMESRSRQRISGGIRDSTISRALEIFRNMNISGIHVNGLRQQSTMDLMLGKKSQNQQHKTLKTIEWPETKQELKEMLQKESSCARGSSLAQIGLYKEYPAQSINQYSTQPSCSKISKTKSSENVTSLQPANKKLAVSQQGFKSPTNLKHKSQNALSSNIYPNNITRYLANRSGQGFRSHNNTYASMYSRQGKAASILRQ